MEYLNKNKEYILKKYHICIEEIEELYNLCSKRIKLD